MPLKYKTAKPASSDDSVRRFVGANLINNRWTNRKKPNNHQDNSINGQQQRQNLAAILSRVSGTPLINWRYNAVDLQKKRSRAEVVSNSCDCSQPSTSSNPPDLTEFGEISEDSSTADFSSSTMRCLHMGDYQRYFGTSAYFPVVPAPSNGSQRSFYGGHMANTPGPTDNQSVSVGLRQQKLSTQEKTVQLGVEKPEVTNEDFNFTISEGKSDITEKVRRLRSSQKRRKTSTKSSESQDSATARKISMSCLCANCDVTDAELLLSQNRASSLPYVAFVPSAVAGYFLPCTVYPAEMADLPPPSCCYISISRNGSIASDSLTTSDEGSDDVNTVMRPTKPPKSSRKIPLITITIPPNCHILPADDSVRVTNGRPPYLSRSGDDTQLSSDDFDDLSSLLSDCDFRDSTSPDELSVDSLDSSESSGYNSNQFESHLSSDSRSLGRFFTLGV